MAASSATYSGPAPSSSGGGSGSLAMEDAAATVYALFTSSVGAANLDCLTIDAWTGTITNKVPPPARPFWPSFVRFFPFHCSLGPFLPSHTRAPLHRAGPRQVGSLRWAGLLALTASPSRRRRLIRRCRWLCQGLRRTTSPRCTAPPRASSRSVAPGSASSSWTWCRSRGPRRRRPSHSLASNPPRGRRPRWRWPAERRGRCGATPCTTRAIAW